MTEPGKYRTVYRDFLYLNGDAVLNGLSAVLGGQESERLDAVVKELGGDAGAKFGAFGAGLNFGLKGSRLTRREITRRATVHSQVEQFIHVLDEKNGIADLTSAANVERAEEGWLVRFSCMLPHLGDKPLEAPRAPTLLDRLLLRDPVARAMAQHVKAVGRGPRTVENVPIADPKGDVSNGTALALELDPSYLVVDRLSDFARHATVLAQVVCKATAHERVVARDDPEGVTCLALVSNARATEGGAVSSAPQTVRVVRLRAREAEPSRWHPIRRLKFRRYRGDPPPAKTMEAGGNPSSNDDTKGDEAPGRGVPAGNGVQSDTPISIGVRPLIIYR